MYEESAQEDVAKRSSYEHLSSRCSLFMTPYCIDMIKLSSLLFSLSPKESVILRNYSCTMCGNKVKGMIYNKTQLQLPQQPTIHMNNRCQVKQPISTYKAKRVIILVMHAQHSHLSGQPEIARNAHLFYIMVLLLKDDDTYETIKGKNQNNKYKNNDMYM